MTNESVELEKMVAQKTLELDQRDQLLQQHKCVLQAKDEMIPMIKGIKHGTGKECIERLHAVLYEQQTTYLNKVAYGLIGPNYNNYKPTSPAI